MAQEQQDLVDLFDAVWTRFARRVEGLGDDEWAWCPTADERVGLRWRLEHLRELLAQERNGTWLGAPGRHVEPAPAASAAAALTAVQAAYAGWRDLVRRPDLDLGAPVGPAAGRYSAATRRSFVLHVADELVHHTAEVALLRDLYGHAGGREP